MYLFYLTMKTVNGIVAICILLYSIMLSIICPKLKKNKNYKMMCILCALPTVFALVHFFVYGRITLWVFSYLYVEALLPLILLLPGKKKVLIVMKSLVTFVLTLGACFIFLINAIASPMVHNFSRDSYTESFQKMLNTMEKEYALSSWKKINYDALLEEYLPRVEEAEKNKNETEYAAIISEVIYRFYDSHVYADLDSDLQCETEDYFCGNDYGLSMIQIDDGSFIAILVEPESEVAKFGIHDGTTILKWDNQDVKDAVSKVEFICPSFAFPVKGNEDVMKPLYLAGKGGDSIEITFIDDDGNIQNITAKKFEENTYSDRMIGAYIMLQNIYNMDYSNNVSYMLDDKCGYLRIRKERYDNVKDNVAAVRKGYYPELTALYADLIGDLQNQGMEYLIVDIRNNVGGYDCCAGALTSLFTDEKRHMVAFGYEDEEGYHIKENQYIFPDGRYKDIPVVALVNSECVSAGDGMAKFLGECDNVTLMGFTASGGVNQNNGGYIYLTDRICVEYPVFFESFI
ncbi:MAG: S41 family peptidase [Eubacteriales bacterium]|nr:S41 family peptidase [Eubacteriales bacterium]